MSTKKEKMSDVIVLIPGIMGSVLSRMMPDGKREEVWTASFGTILSAMFENSKRFDKLMIEDDPVDRDDLDDDIVATKLMPDVHMIPGLWKIDGYSRISKEIRERFDVTPDLNFFEFPYDWRRDNRVSARRLARLSHAWLRKWRDLTGNADAKLILICHSMGGLVARYFLELMDGWRDTRALISFGTPYRGSLNAIDTLVNGSRKGPFKLHAMTKLGRSLTSLYQLLPTYKCFDPGDGQLVQVADASIPQIDRARARSALAFHREIESGVVDHLQAPGYLDGRYLTFPVVGIQQPTNTSARLRGGVVEIGKTYEGDGTVPRGSAVPLEIEKDHREIYSGTKHASIQNAKETITQLTGILTGLYFDFGVFRSAVPLQVPPMLALELDDVYWNDEPIKFRVDSGGPGQDFAVVVQDAKSNQEMASTSIRADANGGCDAELRPLGVGAYRIVVKGDHAVEPVMDVFAVTERR